MVVTKVLGIVDSPRRNGNTEILVDEVLRGAKETGAAVPIGEADPSTARLWSG